MIQIPTRQFSLLLLLVLTSGQAMAWKGSAEMGLLATSGNTDTLSYHYGITLSKEIEQNTYKIQSSGLRSEEDGNQNAARDSLAAQHLFDLSNKSRLETSLNAEQDEFSAYFRQFSLKSAYGRLWLDHEHHQIRSSTGVGYRHQETQDSGETLKNAIVYLAIEQSLKLNEKVLWKNKLESESGKDDQYIHFLSSIESAINAKLSLLVKLDARHHTKAPGGRKGSDMQMAVNLKYKFN